MSGSMNEKTAHRARLLTTVSALALFASVCGAQNAQGADDAGRPVLWIGVSGTLDMLNGGEDEFLPPFLTSEPRSAFETVSGASLQRLPRTGWWDGDADITFQPADTNWVLSASVRYGRTTHHKNSNQQPPPYRVTYSGYAYGPYAFDAAGARNMEGHIILDFQVGRDIGLGMFSARGSSVISAGVRYASFDSRSEMHWSSQPAVPYVPHLFHGASALDRKFAGTGPSLSWKASVPLAGNTDNGSISLDLGANGAVLFGRQRVNGHHRAEADGVYSHYTLVARSRAVSVPNFGGFAGITYRLQEVKLSLGYRADIFSGAIDGGIDARKDENRGFYGPFASVSLGLGD